MKISIIQPDIVWEDKTANLKHLESLLIPLFNKTDLVVLPEMFNSGFSMNPDRLSEPQAGETFMWMSDMSVRGNFGLCGSYTVKDDTNYFNRLVFITPQGTTGIMTRDIFLILKEKPVCSSQAEKELQ